MIDSMWSHMIDSMWSHTRHNHHNGLMNYGVSGVYHKKTINPGLLLLVHIFYFLLREKVKNKDLRHSYVMHTKHKQQPKWSLFQLIRITAPNEFDRDLYEQRRN